MKAVFTYIMITFALSMFLYLGGVITDDNIGAAGNETRVDVSIKALPADSQHFSAARLFVDIGRNNIKSSEIWTALLYLVGAIVLGISANLITGGNASVGITLGLSVFIWWVVGLVGDFITLINKMKVDCILNAAGQCTDFAYWIVWGFGVLLAIGFVYSLFDLIVGND